MWLFYRTRPLETLLILPVSLFGISSAFSSPVTILFTNSGQNLALRERIIFHFPHLI